MERSQIKSAVSDFLRKECYLADDQSGGDVPLFSSSLLSSLDFIDLVSFIEKNYGIVVEATDAGIENLDTVNRITEFILRQRSAS